jgi:hypothetical protein
MMFPETCEACSSADLRYQYDRHEPVLVPIGTGQTVEMPAAGQQGVLQVSCLSCGTVTVHHVGWFDPPVGDGRWTVRTVSAGAVGTQTPTFGAGPRPDDDQQDSPRYNDRDPE